MTNSRVKMNSESLQQAFPQVYQDFFAKCQLVVSATRSFTWLGEQAVRYEGLMVRHHLPLRTYIGLVPKKQAKVEIMQCLDFDPLLQNFREGAIDAYQQDKVERYFLDFLKDVCKIEAIGGFDIYILNELPLERGLGSIGALFLPLVAGALILRGKLKIDNIAKWPKQKTAHLLEDQAYQFDYLFRSAWKWENFVYPGVSGANLFGSILPSAYPFLFMSKKMLPPHLAAAKEVQLEELDFVDQSFYWGARLPELCQKIQGWPLIFDYGLIHTGELRDIRASIHVTNNVFNVLNDDADEFLKYVDPHLGSLKLESLPFIYKICKEKTDLWRQFISTLLVNAMQGFLRFRKIFEQGYSAEALRDFVELMNREQHLFHILNLSAGNLDHMCLATHDALTENGRGDIIAAAKMSGTTRRGDIIFLTNSRRVRTQIDQILKQLKSEFGDFIHLDYASWLDDDGGEGGLKVEQYLQEKVYSSFVPANALRLEEHTAVGQNNQIVSPTRFQKDQFDLLLDTIHEKIYLHGKPTTSKKLPSQKAAIEILVALLGRLGQIVSNKDLPMASYSSYRNEFQGKITSPLLKLMGEKMKIEVDGGLMDFTVRLELARGTKVGVLKKI